jgi:putative cardiolipin synthase
MMRRFFHFGLLVVVSLVSGCATIDYDYPRTESMTLANTEQTRLGMGIAALSPDDAGGMSGFYPLIDGIEALSTRLLLAERAEVSIDTQYYLVKTDNASMAFIYSLLRAADRGVRVRLLIDDVFTKGYDAGMAALDAHPNFEVRVFNPFQRGVGGRAWSGITNFARVNRRMHTKSFTVDNQVTIVGGRNIADEYFGARADARFGDLDVVGIGHVADDVSRMFDSFWNHETALPVPAFSKMPDDPAAELESLRERLRVAYEAARASRYAEAVRATVLGFMERGGDSFEWTPYELVYDSPDKGIRSKDGPAVSIVEPLIEALQSAQEEVIVVSPYFVPLKTGIRFFSELEARGVEVTIVTNSLAANNQVTVHGGYAPSRKPLLRSGVRIYEVRPDAEIAGSEIVAASGAKSTLHTKAFFVDGKKTFIGSFNFDPRSANLHTESGVLIESETLTRLFTQGVENGVNEKTYELFLDENGKLRWRGYEDGREVIHTNEPESTWAQRFIAGIVRLLPVKSQL